jgi:septum formation protein
VAGLRGGSGSARLRRADLAGQGRRVILASASPARSRLLESAGVPAEVIVSEVDEGGVDNLPPADAVLTLARRKATAVAARVGVASGALVIGCDSLLELDGRAEGKPASAAAAVRLWRRMRARTGWLHTGHCVIDTVSDAEAAATDTALVRFGNPSDVEIRAYVATGEPLRVAGAFTLDGFGAPWIDSIDGNYGTIAGLSLPVLRRLLADLGISLIDLWGEARDLAHHDFRARVETVVAALRPGEVVSYGDVAAEAGRSGAARAVGAIMASPGQGRDLPWWRVVTATGRLVPGHEAEHARRLTQEGVEIVDGRVARPGARRRPGPPAGRIS